MNMNKTHLAIVIDRSGSMVSIKEDAQGGINSLINSQKDLPGEASLDIFDFDNTTTHCVDLDDIKKFEKYTLSPRGGTALYDAVCEAVDKVGAKLSAMKEEDRPGLVLFAIVTDGEENSSRKFTFEDMQKRVKLQADVYNWKFSFLCADPTTCKVGIEAGFTSNAVYNTANSAGMYNAVGSKFARMRGMAASSLPVVDEYNASEKAMLNSDNKN